MDIKPDGRRKAKFSSKKNPQLLPKVMVHTTNASVERIIKLFDATGKTIHSENRSTLQYVIDHCEEKDIPYVIHADPRRGYFIEKDLEIIKRRVEDKLDGITSKSAPRGWEYV